MAKPTNKDKEEPIDESILDETPPNINEPQAPEEEDKAEKKVDKKPDPIPEDAPEEDETLPEDKEEEKDPEPEETETEKRHKAQQTEAQILAARNRALNDKVDEASKLPEPTIDELKAFVAQDGVDWDDLTVFEQATAKRTFIAEKRFSLVNEAVQVTKKIDEWASKVDEFLDSIEGKAEFIKLNGHESDFRKFAMKESHRGVSIESLLVPAFIQNLPNTPKKRGSLLETGGGGDTPDKPSKITPEEAAQIRQTQGEKAYKRLVQSGRIDETL